jgi:hypothetical protein
MLLLGHQVCPLDGPNNEILTMVKLLCDFISVKASRVNNEPGLLKEVILGVQRLLLSVNDHAV